MPAGGAGNGGKNDIASSLGHLGDVVAVAITFIALPELYARSIGWVSYYTGTRYGVEFIPLCAAGWFVILGLMVFFTARATTALLVMSGVAAFMLRVA